jgi:hypothetical protein
MGTGTGTHSTADSGTDIHTAGTGMDTEVLDTDIPMVASMDKQKNAQIFTRL